MRRPDKLTFTRLVKCGMSAAVFAKDAVVDLFTRLSRRTPPGKCVVIYYHSVPRSQRAAFARQMAMLRRHFEPVSLDGDVFVPSGRQCVAVTMDDAFANLIDNALPELERYNIPATIFVISSALGKMFGEAERPERVMSAEQLRDLPEDLITIGSHSVTHPFLPTLGKEAARREIVDSRAQLSELLGRDIRLFSFPFGGFSKELIRRCREAGYHRVFTTLPDYAFCSNHEFAVGRVRVDPTDWPMEGFLKMAGAYRWLPWAFRVKRRILLSGIGKILRPKGRPSGMPVPRAVIQ